MGTVTTVTERDGWLYCVRCDGPVMPANHSGGPSYGPGHDAETCDKAFQAKRIAQLEAEVQRLNGAYLIAEGERAGMEHQRDEAVAQVAVLADGIRDWALVYRCPDSTHDDAVAVSEALAALAEGDLMAAARRSSSAAEVCTGELMATSPSGHSSRPV